MENDKNLNWNAGTQYNDIIGRNKLLFIENSAVGNVRSCLSILSNDIDITYKKILLEAQQDKKVNIDEVKKKLDLIRLGVDNLEDQYRREYSNKTFMMTLHDEITKLKRGIWDLQAEHGVLFPLDKTKKMTWEEEIRDDYN